MQEGALACSRRSRQDFAGSMRNRLGVWHNGL